MTTAALVEKPRGIGGRKPLPVSYAKITTSQEYVIGTICKLDGSLHKFVIDAADEARVKERNWHSAVRDAYVASSVVTEDGTKTCVYLHNFIMNRFAENDGNSVDHIDGNGWDNRRANLRIVSQSLQNMNTRKRERKTTKVPLSIDVSTIPRNIWYIPSHGLHGDRFAVEIKGIPDVPDICWKSTSSKSIATADKLTNAIEKRREFYELYPVLKEHSRLSDLSTLLAHEFLEIVGSD